MALDITFVVINPWWKRRESACYGSSLCTHHWTPSGRNEAQWYTHKWQFGKRPISICQLAACGQFTRPAMSHGSNYFSRLLLTITQKVQRTAVGHANWQVMLCSCFKLTYNLIISDNTHIMLLKITNINCNAMWHLPRLGTIKCLNIYIALLLY